MLCKLHGKELTAILKAIGQPGLVGKKKERQISLLTDAIKKGIASINIPKR